MSSIVGVALALTASLLFGSGDFSGGVASRRLNQFQVLALSTSVSVIPLVLLALLWHEGLPAPASLLWAALAGILGSLGLAALYRGLAIGSAAIVSPTAAVIAAAVPVVYTGLAEGLPAAPKLGGFGLALAGIWLVARPHPASLPNHGQGLRLGILSGIAFGAFFIFIAQVQRGAVFFPLAMARLASIPMVLLVLAWQRLPLPSPASSPMALLAGTLDALANACFLSARQYTRLDVAAVLASLYPAVTVMLAYLIHKEVISRSQWLGLAMCLAAIGLIVY